MERDFLGLRKDGGQLVTEEFRARGQDGAYLGSAMQWPFSNKASAMQQYMFYKASQDQERQKKFAVEQFPSSGFQSMQTMDAFEASQKTPVPVSSQKFDRQVIHQFPMQPYQSQCGETLISSPHQLNDNRAFPVVSHYSIPVATSSPFFKVHGAQNGPNIAVAPLNQPYGVNMSTSGAGSASVTFPSRTMPKRAPVTGQMTIFYAGSVNVFDDVSFEKAQAIMSLASKGSKKSVDAAEPRSEAQVQASAKVPTVKTTISTTVSVPTLQTTVSSPTFQTMVPVPTLQAAVPILAKIPASDGLNSKKITNPSPVRVASPCSAVSSPMSVTSRIGANSGGVSSTTDDTAGAKAVGPLATASHQETSKSSTDGSGSTPPSDAMPRAIPQARKASLARFLEKRKERITSVMPYACTKKNPESGVRLDAANAVQITSSKDVNTPSKRAGLWCVGQSNASIISGESPSTKLEM